VPSFYYLTRNIMNVSTQTPALSASVINVLHVLEQNQGKYIDGHNGKIKTITHAAVFNNHVGEKLVTVNEDTVCCINPYYVTDDGQVELSRWSIGGTVDYDGNELIERLRAWNNQESAIPGFDLGKFSQLITFTNGVADIQRV